MAAPATTKGTKVHILMGDSATPTEAFTAYCGLTARSIAFTKSTSDTYVPDCDNPDDPAWRQLAVNGRSATITGSGLLDQNALSKYQGAWDDSDGFHARVEIGVPLAMHGGYWVGTWHLTRFEVTGNQGALTTVAITLENDGPITWVPASA